MDVSLSELRESVMDRKAWHAEIHGVAKSQTRLSNWTELNWTGEKVDVTWTYFDNYFTVYVTQTFMLYALNIYSNMY